MLSLLPHLLTLVASMALFLYAWPRRHVPGARPFMIITFSQVVWMFGLIEELIALSLPLKMFWDHFQWIGTFGYVFGFLAFTLEVGQRRLIHIHWKWVLALTPVVLFWIAGWNSAWLTHITPGAQIIPGQPFDQLSYPFGVIQLLVSAYGYLIVIIAIGVSLYYLRHVDALYQRSLIGMLLGCILPFVVSILALLGFFSWFGQRDVTPYTFAISDLLFMVSIFGYSIFDLTSSAYQTIFHRLRDPVLVFGSDGVLNAINPAACDLFDLSQGQTIGHSAAEIFTLYPKLRTLIESQQEGQHQIELVSRKQNIAYELDITQLRTRRGRSPGWIAIFHRITPRYREDTQPLQRFTLELDRRQRQQAIIAEMTANFNAADQPEDVIQAISQALSSLDYDTFSIWRRQDQKLVWYQEISQLPGWLTSQGFEIIQRWAKSDEIEIGIPLNSENQYTRCYRTQEMTVLRGADDILNPIQIFDQHFTELPGWLQTLTHEMVTRLKISEHYLFPLSQYGVAFLNKSGSPPNIDQIEWVQLICQQAGVALDRLMAIEAYQKLNIELEMRVNERTAQLEEANRELEAFAYSVSHDLRAPLRAINGFSEILKTEYDYLLDDKGKLLLQRVREAVDKMASLIDALLKLSRLTRTEMHTKPIDLTELSRKVASNLEQNEPQRPVTWRIHQDLSANGDPNMIYIVLENLLSNAWKFTSQREQAVIEVGNQNQDSSCVFYIRDNGVGFDMAYADKLFAAFQRLHSDTEFEGTGIGLATVQRIIRRHGGRVWAEGKLNEGATFYFTLGD